MITAAKRSLDDGGPFVLPAPPLDPARPTCAHGIFIETRFDARSDVSADELALLIRPGEQLDGTSVRADGEPVAISLSLGTGRCTPRDERAERFLDAYPWLENALAERLAWLRARARRAADQLDRTSYVAALDRAEPGMLVPYDDLFPANWDLLFTHAGHTYWSVDHHCVNPACSCSDVVVELHRIGTRKAEHIGQVRFDQRKTHERPKASSPLAAEVFARLWAKHEKELVRRHDEVRAAVLTRGARPLAVAVSRPGRNSPCPCGSGKKYKRCCADRDAAPATG
ncbi:MAG: SEC-C metal-binding domain-containing protein [Byssovorax sp.]